MSSAAFSHDTDESTGDFVSPTATGSPFTHNTTSNRRPCPGGPKLTSSDTTRWFEAGLSKSISRTGTCSVVPLNLWVCWPRSHGTIRSFAATNPSVGADRSNARSTGRTSSTRSGASAINGFNRTNASTRCPSNNTPSIARGNSRPGMCDQPKSD